ncbi:hypothetical protein GGTG_08491 [Gaeumannomyces tritici R3-111a-1]|uniref:Uncharacterized protein n=1 Tax=Gaeumannomyces tritici (strain R3-111a-1) TaxID=644352 RepID=J3P4Q4_GAET3|nr:hypothetical protein GGTG_08491 [Gaeumannomyces tritici R3-111a-1]EJT74651.1 hypothetical protein GGTG_08491 [Gaeumannomyces tritici R3-111a-1]
MSLLSSEKTSVVARQTTSLDLFRSRRRPAHGAAEPRAPGAQAGRLNEAPSSGQRIAGTNYSATIDGWHRLPATRSQVHSTAAGQVTSARPHARTAPRLAGISSHRTTSLSRQNRLDERNGGLASVIFGLCRSLTHVPRGDRGGPQRLGTWPRPGRVRLDCAAAAYVSHDAWRHRCSGAQRPPPARAGRLFNGLSREPKDGSGRSPTSATFLLSKLDGVIYYVNDAPSQVLKEDGRMDGRGQGEMRPEQAGRLQQPGGTSRGARAWVGGAHSRVPPAGTKPKCHQRGGRNQCPVIVAAPPGHSALCYTKGEIPLVGGGGGERAKASARFVSGTNATATAAVRNLGGAQHRRGHGAKGRSAWDDMTDGWTGGQRRRRRRPFRDCPVGWGQQRRWEWVVRLTMGVW